MDGDDTVKDKTIVRYYSIRASVFWCWVALCIVLISGLIISQNAEGGKTQQRTAYTEYGTIMTQLKNVNECYLCGDSNESMMDYYRKFDTVGIIGLNQWYILDLRLKEYDSEGNFVAKKGSSEDYGSMPTMKYGISAIPSRGMSSVTIQSTDGMFDETVIKKHLCQKCLDKVSNTLARDTVEGQEEYLPFCVVDFETLELYPLQREGHSYFVRDYWVQIESINDDVEIEVMHLPEIYEDNGE